ncbi:MAG TPA: hypothetical protein VFG10_03345 [Saprospiraceae bacterium]|nr:hypothetical protein [Saprospiraceae bacterium]
MSVIINWEQLLVPVRLLSGDLIRVTARPTALPSSKVEFQLSTAPGVTWEKRIRFFNSRGEIAFLRTEGSNHLTAPANFSTDAFNKGELRFELVKAMSFGTLTGVYELKNVGRWKGQSLLFEWLAD